MKSFTTRNLRKGKQQLIIQRLKNSNLQKNLTKNKGVVPKGYASSKLYHNPNSKSSF
jgi:hypothetical protein